MLATGLVLLLGVTFGVQIIRYWRAEPERPVDGRLLELDPAIDMDATLRFGDFQETIDRRIVSGNIDVALAAMVRQCSQALKSLRPEFPGPQSAAEARLMAEISNATPAERIEGIGNVYVQPGPMPMAIGVFFGRPNGRTQAESFGENRPRVLCWTLALPFVLRDENGSETTSLPDRWTVVTCRPFSASAGRFESESIVSLPDGAKRTLSIRTEGGGQLLGFSGEGDPDQWGRWFAKQLESEGWRVSRPSATGNQIRAVRHDGQQLDILFNTQYRPDQSAKKLHGLIRFSHQTVTSSKD